MSFRSIITLAATLASINAHMIMESPVPFSADKIDNGPITAAQFPCKSNLGFTVTKMNTMAVGTKQQLSFKGTAVHGGGSCQLSVTTDTEPSANSVFKVIKSMEGECPGVDGAKKFDFELPASIPNGKATFAWTWFAKLSGGPEMYMNCAPIEVTGGASDNSAFNALPDMLVANIATSSCKSPTSKVLKIPNPGQNLVTAGSEADILDGTGDCGASSGGSTPAQPSSPTGQSPTSSQSPAAGQPSSPAGEYPSEPSAATPSAPLTPPSNPGGVAPGASGAPSLTGTPAPASSATPGTGSPSAPGTSSPASPGTGYPSAPGTSSPASPGTGSPSAPGTSSPASPGTSSPAAPGTGSSTAPGTGAPIAPGTGAPASSSAPLSPSAPSPATSGGSSTSTCTTPGAIVCNGEKQFGICNNGSVIWQPVAAGSTCANGAVTKRSFNSRITRGRTISAKVAAN